MQPKKSSWKWCLLVLAVFALVAAGCACKRLTPANAPEAFPCAAQDKVVTEIGPEAELAELACSFEKWEGVETLHFNVAVKNVSEQPQRYRVNIFLDNGKAVGGLIPRRMKDGLVNPGDTATFVYPVKEEARQPKELLVKISTLSQ